MIQNKYKRLKTLVLKLKPSRQREDLSSLNPDQLDGFVEEMIVDLQNSLLSNTNDLRERIKKGRPDPSDPQYEKKMAIYKELLEQMIPIMQKLQHFVGQTLDELHSLIKELWNDISNNDGKEVERLLEEHQHRTELHMTEQWTKDIQQLEAKLQTLLHTNNQNIDF